MKIKKTAEIPASFMGLPAHPLEPVDQFRSPGPFIGKLGDEQRERLGISGDAQGAGIHGFEARIADQSGGHLFTVRIVPAVDEAGFGTFLPGLEDVEEHFARDRVECGDDPGLGNLPWELRANSSSFPWLRA
jgi:hypothetical protein